MTVLYPKIGKLYESTASLELRRVGTTPGDPRRYKDDFVKIPFSTPFMVVDIEKFNDIEYRLTLLTGSALVWWYENDKARGMFSKPRFDLDCWKEYSGD